MKSYLFSLFSRFFLAFSGFLVFVVTAALYGAEGRGIIGYGNSLFAVIGLILSLNLGRAFLGMTKQNQLSKEQHFKTFLLLNVVLSLLTSLVGLAFWNFSSVAQGMLSAKQILIFSLSSFFHVWSVNGNSFYASFLMTRVQERIILFTRVLLMIFLGLLYWLEWNSLDNFLAGYSVILFLGTLCEMLILFFFSKGSISLDVRSLVSITGESRNHHVDYLAFHLFPLLLTVFLAFYEKSQNVGKFNFTLQLINLIFLFSTTANIRISSYVSDVGFKARLSQFKKLLWATFLISSISVLLIFSLLIIMTKLDQFAQFEGVESLFLITTLAIPGYVFYQFFNPIWIDLQIQSKAAIVHAINLMVFAVLSHFVLKNFGVTGAVWLIVFFHFGLGFSQYLLFRLVFRGSSILTFIGFMGRKDVEKASTAGL